MRTSQQLRSELYDRLAQHKSLELGGLSDDAYAELRQAVVADPDTYLTRSDDRAFAEVVRAVAANEDDMASEELIDDDEAYAKAVDSRLDRLHNRCDHAFETYPGTDDAIAMMAMIRSREPDTSLAKLQGARTQVLPQHEEVARSAGLAMTKPKPGQDVWECVDERPRLRLLATIARAQAETGRYRGACATCEQIIGENPSDMLGARFTWAICLARLEDEKGLDDLDAQFGRAGNAWMHLARTLLLFKLGRIPAAKRALKGYARLCRGGAHALLRPTFVEPYLPARPPFDPGSYTEARLAVHECDPVIMDTPDFLAWASSQDGFSEQARAFARDNDLDW